MFIKKFSYGLHDAKINKVSFEGSQIVLRFDTGVYNLLNGKETTFTKACSMRLTIDDLTLADCEKNVEIIQYSKNKYAELSIENFIKDVAAFGFDIDIDYYSPFNRSVLLRGFVGKSRTDMEITDIKDISILFEE